MEEVRDGTLDYALTKPADAQILVSVREFRVWQLIDLVIGMVVLIVAGIELRSSIGLAQVAAFLVAIFLGSLMIYPIT